MIRKSSQFSRYYFPQVERALGFRFGRPGWEISVLLLGEFYEPRTNRGQPSHWNGFISYLEWFVLKNPPDSALKYVSKSYSKLKEGLVETSADNIELHFQCDQRSRRKLHGPGPADFSPVSRQPLTKEQRLLTPPLLLTANCWENFNSGHLVSLWVVFNNSKNWQDSRVSA